MPELPEVETTCRGIRPHLLGKTFQQIIVRNAKLRWPIPQDIHQQLHNEKIISVERRAKYLLLKTKMHTLIIHLGMSGSLYITDPNTPPEKHDHVDFLFNKKICLRYTDPRRFGAILITDQDLTKHPLFIKLGVEPLTSDFNADYLYQHAKSRGIAIKNFIMNSHIVTGIGNIYASEALFLAGIHPTRATNRIAKSRYTKLTSAIKTVLEKAILAGGTTLRDFVNGEKKPGYFSQQLQVYGREGETCGHCKTIIKKIVQGQRSSFYCPRCQR